MSGLCFLSALRALSKGECMRIGKGADVNAKVEFGPLQGMTPLDSANNSGRTEIVSLLRKHGGKTKKELEAAGK